MRKVRLLYVKHAISMKLEVDIMVEMVEAATVITVIRGPW